MWDKNEPVGFESSFTWSDFQLLKYTFQEVSTNYTYTGTFSKVMVQFYLSRSFSPLMLDIYIPIVLLVVVSWCSFWIEIPAAPARVTLGVTTMLTMVTTSKSSREKQPPVPYIHALDLWILVSIFFVFASLVEYTAVSYIFYREKRANLKRRKRLKSQRRKTSLAKQELVDSSSECCSIRLSCNMSRFTGLFKSSAPKQPRLVEGGEEVAIEIDRQCRLIFPVLYACFNLLYWVTMFALSQQQNAY